MKQLTATIIAALFCAACGTTQLKNSPALELSDVDSIHIMPGTPHLIRADNAKIISTAELLNMVGQVDYLKLDSSEPIGEISKMVVTRDKIFILDAHIAQQIFVFNKPVSYYSVSKIKAGGRRNTLVSGICRSTQFGMKSC